jgi:hypothetical protein
LSTSGNSGAQPVDSKDSLWLRKAHAYSTAQPTRSTLGFNGDRVRRLSPMMAAQSPLDCKDANDSDWMRNDQQLSPCISYFFAVIKFADIPKSIPGRVLASSIQQFDPAFNLTWLDLSFHCPSASNSTNQALSGICCSSITFSLYSACWSCQFDQLVQGVVHTTWGDFASNCSLQSNGNGQQSRGQIGSLPASVQSKLSAAEIHLPPWTFLPTSDDATW